MLRSAHKWLGVLIAPLLLAVIMSGVLLLWNPEYIKSTVPNANTPPAYSVASLGLATERILSAYPNGTVRLIEFFPRDIGLHKVILTDSRCAWHDQDGGALQSGACNRGLNGWLHRLHDGFLRSDELGQNLLGVTAILLIALLVLGAKTWVSFGRRSQFKVLPISTQPSQLRRSHRNLGLILVLPTLLIALSGIVLVYPTEVAKLVLGDPARQNARQKTLAGYAALPNIEAKLEFASSEAFPGAKVRWVRPPNGGYDKFLVGVQQAGSLNRLGRSYVIFDNHRPIERLDAQAQTFDKRLFDFILPLHSGNFSMWYRLSLSAIGLLLIAVIGLALFSTLKTLRR